MSKKQIGLSKNRPKNEAIPLGIPRMVDPKTKKVVVAAPKVVDSPVDVAVSSVDVESNPEPTTVPTSAGVKYMSLNLKGISKNGRSAIYSIGRRAIRIPVTAFPDAVAPKVIEVAEGTFATVKPAMTLQERRQAWKNRPKLSLADRIKKEEERLARLRNRLAQAEELKSAEQPQEAAATL